MADGSRVLAPLLTSPRKAVPRGAPAPTYDCGPHGMLTMAQMVRLSGVTKQTLLYRLQQGWTGDALVSGRTTTARYAPRFDCGNGLRLTCRQIEKRTGLTRSGVQRRLDRGVRGEALLIPRCAPRLGRPIRSTVRTAIRLARTFPDRLPTTEEIIRAVPMSQTNATRYRAALHEAMTR